MGVKKTEVIMMFFVVLWIPAFAGMTKGSAGMTGGTRGGDIGYSGKLWIPAFAGMTKGSVGTTKETKMMFFIIMLSPRRRGSRNFL
ncbi:MAG: hypothetical protein CR972_02345 [Candidatus Moraniibacteriota bacterium]|nr:MAG: hypothetical protein CR972_02345 [Candidatus Moranbacteria bacterium]